ncbi:hypothetical protein FDF31_04225 [Clostridium sporogenes]|uniref:hypothetical protein n=1 Tax=unclassified Clostridium TaxID=2614128 RepID=UPI0013D0B60D|nr:hypothetical protein [Clostridium sporogenes]NFS24872.1 hypothetical protein [Clostridium sporogenes]
MSSLKLQLPNNYVEIEGSEMEYIDGGWRGITICSVTTAGKWIDGGIIAASWAFGVGSAVSAYKTSMRRLVQGVGARTAKSIVKQAATKALSGLAASTVGTAVDLAFNFLDLSPGLAIAKGIDCIDARRYSNTIDI